jgi:hypothetical protein
VFTPRPNAAARQAGVTLWIVLVLLPAPAHAADPLLMFFLGFARNLISSAIEEHNAKSPPRVVAPKPPPKSAAQFDEADLRALVDDSFAYLSGAQRAELLSGLEKTLSDPANAAQREAILTQFVNVARRIQFTHGQLSLLSGEEKRALAARFADNFRSLTPDQQQALLEQLRLRALPLPADLNDMMLAALSTER